MSIRSHFGSRYFTKPRVILISCHQAMPLLAHAKARLAKAQAKKKASQVPGSDDDQDDQDFRVSMKKTQVTTFEEALTNHDITRANRFHKQLQSAGPSAGYRLQSGTAGTMVGVARANSLSNAAPGYNPEFLIPYIQGDSVESMHIRLGLTVLWQTYRFFFQPLLQLDTGDMVPSLGYANTISLAMAGMAAASGMDLESMNRCLDLLPGNYTVYTVDQRWAAGIAAAMDTPGHIATALLSLFRPRHASRLFDGTATAPLLTARPTAHYLSAAPFFERLPQESIDAVMAMFEKVLYREVTTDQVAQVFACSVLQLVKPVNMSAHDAYHKARERAECLKLRCPQLGSEMANEPSESLNDYLNPAAAVSKELYETFNRDAASRAPLINWADLLQHSPVAALRVACQQLIPLLAYNSSSWFVITDLVLSMFPLIEGIRQLEPCMIYWRSIKAFAAKYKKNPRELALARVKGVDGAQVFSRNGIETLIAISARIGAKVARPSWERVETSKKDLLVDEQLIESIVSECVEQLDENKRVLLKSIGTDEDEDDDYED